MKSKEYKEILEAYKNVYEQRVGVETKNPDETLQKMVDRQNLDGKVIPSKSKLQKSHYEPSGDSINESHFKVGDEVICKKSGMEGEVIKVDSEEKGKYYTVKREDGKTMKYAPSELKLEDENEDGGASKKKETEFHDKLDKMVHKTFGKRKEEKAMKEGTEEVSEDLQSAVEKGLDAAAKNPVVKAIGKVISPVSKGRKTPTATSGGYRPVKEESDIFDIILEHLVAEGYADTNKAALAIMTNMSEEWKKDIIENRGMAYSGGKAGASGDGSKPKGITGGKTYQMPGWNDKEDKKQVRGA